VRLLLCRHADTGNAAQADTLAQALAEQRLAVVYTSPLARAVDTARRIVAAPIVVDDLREIELGEVAELQFEQYPVDLQAALLASPASVSFPGGESYEELRTRVVGALEQIVARHPGDVVTVVSHAGAIRSALATWLGVAPDASFRLDQSFAALNVIDWTDGVPFVRLVNGATMPAALGAVL
jgi:broad specificity phosphatase PhoE